MRFAFVLYPGIEPIDIAAIGVVSMGKRVVPSMSYVLVANSLEPKEFANGMRVLPDFTFETCPNADVIIIPGGPGWPAASQDESVLSFLRHRAPGSLLVSTCTGGMILAGTGLLNGRRATTKNIVRPSETSPLSLMAREHPSITVVKALVVDEGTIVSGGGVSLCMDAVLHVIATRIGAQEADEIAVMIEYADAWAANRARLETIAN